jgi:hypothetical protein
VIITPISDLHNEVRRQFRYVFSSETEQFISAFKTIARESEATVQKGTVLYRSQLGHTYTPVKADKGIEMIRYLVPFLQRKRNLSRIEQERGELILKGFLVSILVVV